MIKSNNDLIRWIKKFLRYFFMFFGITFLIVVLFWKPILGFLWHDLPFMGANFDQKIWLSTWECETGKSDLECLYKRENCVRGSMYTNLARNHLLPGMLKEKVIKLLGKAEMAYKHPECVDYPLGFCSGLRIDLDLLRVCFDDKGTIQRVFHYQS